MLRSKRNGNSSFTESPISTNRSASQSPRPSLSNTDMAMSMFCLSWISRFLLSDTAPS